jgi:hypothetical protein
MPARRTLFVTAGQRIGRLTVIDPETRTGFAAYRPNGFRAALCACECGSQVTVQLAHLRGGDTQSCGCQRRDNTLDFNRSARHRDLQRIAMKDFNRTHGMKSHKLYDTWKQMLYRCEAPAHKDYPNYGGRGISVCKSWHDVQAFIGWIEGHLGPRPDRRSLDRIDNDGNYEPGNVRWATPAEQRRNQRPRG